MSHINFKQKRLADNIRGRSIYKKVIPTVCYLSNMLKRLDYVDGHFNQLRQWEKRSYKNYRIEDIEKDILHKSDKIKIAKIKKHILSLKKDDIGAACADIYLIAFVADNYKNGYRELKKWAFKEGITTKENSVKAIWSVGRSAGVYLGVLNKDGSIKDYDFFKKWAG